MSPLSRMDFFRLQAVLLFTQFPMGMMQATRAMKRVLSRPACGCRNIAAGWVLFALWLATACGPMRAVAYESLHSTPTVYIESFGDGNHAEAVRKRIVERLEKDGDVRVVDKADGADAVLHGKVVIWETGAISNNPRSNSSRQEMH